MDPHGLYSSENGYPWVQVTQCFKQRIKMEIPFNDLRPLNNQLIIVNSPCSNYMIAKQPADNDLLAFPQKSACRERLH